MAATGREVNPTGAEAIAEFQSQRTGRSRPYLAVVTDLPIPGVDLEVLAGWMDAHGLGDGVLIDVELIAGGTQNVLMRFTRSGRSYVLRRPPVHKRANSDETMRREARVLAALAGSALPRPGLVAAEPDPEILGAAFYLMEPVEGFNATLGLPAAFASNLRWPVSYTHLTLPTSDLV